MSHEFRLAQLAALALALPVHAHHSFTMFDTQNVVTLQGTVKEFQWTNPHCFVQLWVQTANGTVEWSLEMNSPLASQRRGWKPSTLKAGDSVTAVFHPVRDGTPGGMLIRVTDRDGQVFHNLTVQP